MRPISPLEGEMSASPTEGGDAANSEFAAPSSGALRHLLPGGEKGKINGA